MGKDDETSEEKAAKQLRDQQQKDATAAQTAADQQLRDQQKKETELKQRGQGLKGGGREGLMYRGNQAGVKL